MTQPTATDSPYPQMPLPNATEAFEDYFVNETLKPKKGLRMYFLGLYNLSPIQKGIQALHAAVEFARDQTDLAQFEDWADNHKTVILLDAGGSNELDTAINELSRFIGQAWTVFREPDLYNGITSVAFIVPEEVYSIKVTKELIRMTENRLLDPDVLRKNQFAVWLSKFPLAR